MQLTNSCIQAASKGLADPAETLLALQSRLLIEEVAGEEDRQHQDAEQAPAERAAIQ
eukprot:CAMPEP_0195043332 /NCGR_PEP_ID=MMETSP0347-20130606/4130_1 /TAXON_ID=2932 /ORGANISM="Alexandrium fundyense, Strain CCMP1719" /LENGTH=56 /DNA_ID=CAMNT_0040070735 /DNA_START=60 /DNA_END=228 /DNA_ORIENTATION=+